MTFNETHVSAGQLARRKPGQTNAQFGTAAATCKHAASAMGPSGQWGASPTSYVSASAAMRNSSDMPPQCDTYATVTHRSAQDSYQRIADKGRTSGWAIEIARASRYVRKSLREKSRSPSAIGVPTSCARSAVSCGCPGSNGSEYQDATISTTPRIRSYPTRPLGTRRCNVPSMNSGWCGSSTRASCRAMPLCRRPWKSTPTSSPSARTSRRRCTAPSSTVGESIHATASRHSSAAGSSLRQHRPPRTGRVHLHRSEPLRLAPLCRRKQPREIVAADPPVHAHTVAHRAAEQRMHRNAECLSFDVPQRDVEPGERALPTSCGLDQPRVYIGDEAIGWGHAP